MKKSGRKAVKKVTSKLGYGFLCNKTRFLPLSSLKVTRSDFSSARAGYKFKSTFDPIQLESAAIKRG